MQLKQAPKVEPRRSVSGAPRHAEPVFLPPVELNRPIRVGAINNPKAGQNLHEQKFRPILEVLARHPEVKHFEVDRREDIDAAAGDLLNDGAEIIVVNGGDGTVQAVLTYLFNASLQHFPLIAVLPGGTTNMTAGDVGIRGRPAVGLESILRAARSGKLTGVVVRRPVMRIDRVPGEAPQFGMYFAGGVIYNGIQFCRRWVHTVGAKGETGPSITMAIVLARLIFGARGALMPPLRLRGAIEGDAIEADDYVGFQVTTLERLFLGIRPFWGQGPGSIHYTAVKYSPQHAWRTVLPILRGRTNRYVRPEYGYYSRNVDELSLEFDGGFALDGELYRTEPGQPVVFHGGYRAPFLRSPGG